MEVNQLAISFKHIGVMDWRCRLELRVEGELDQIIEQNGTSREEAFRNAVANITTDGMRKEKLETTTKN